MRPVFADGYRAPVGQPEARDVERIGEGVLRQLARTVAVAVSALVAAAGLERDERRAENVAGGLDRLGHQGGERGCHATCHRRRRAELHRPDRRDGEGRFVPQSPCASGGPGSPVTAPVRMAGQAARRKAGSGFGAAVSMAGCCAGGACGAGAAWLGGGASTGLTGVTGLSCAAGGEIAPADGRFCGTGVSCPSAGDTKTAAISTLMANRVLTAGPPHRARPRLRRRLC